MIGVYAGSLYTREAESCPSILIGRGVEVAYGKFF